MTTQTHKILTFAFVVAEFSACVFCMLTPSTRIIHLWQFFLLHSVSIWIMDTWFIFRHCWTFTIRRLTILSNRVSKLFRHTYSGINKLSITHGLQMYIGNDWMNERKVTRTKFQNTIRKSYNIHIVCALSRLCFCVCMCEEISTKSMPPTKSWLK